MIEQIFDTTDKVALAKMRDDIAVRVLIAMIETTPATIEHTASKVVIDRAPGMARTAYHFADAMLAAREGKKATPEEVVNVVNVVKVIQSPVHSIDIKSVIHRTDEFEPGCKVLGLDHGKIGAVTGKPSDVHGQIPVKWANSTYSTYGKPENLEVVQRPLKDGDRVTMKGETGTIQSVLEVRGMAVVQWDKRVPTWELISSLELICKKQP